MAGARAGKLAGGLGRMLAVMGLTTAGTLSAFWLFGAELPSRAPEWSGPAPGFSLETASPVSDAFRRRIEDAMAAVPEKVWRSLGETGWQVQLAEFVVDAAPTLMGERPRGWPNGLTWENTDAVNLPQRRLIVVAERRRNRQGEVVSALRIEGVFRHELGHAFDHAGSEEHGFQSSHPDFIAAYLRDSQAIPDEQREYLAYYLQGDAAGRQEAFAEAFAISLGGGSDPAKRDAFIDAFPRVMGYLQRMIADHAPVAQTAGK